jgi:hypothetical protein
MLENFPVRDASLILSRDKKDFQLSNLLFCFQCI